METNSEQNLSPTPGPFIPLSILPATEGRAWPAPLAEEAFHGIIGEIVRLILPHTESDPAAILFQALAFFGNCVGPGPHFMQERSAHTAREFILLVGKSSRARKGTSLDNIKAIFQRADENYMKKCRASGLGSGEGVVNRVRDPQESTNDKGVTEIVNGAEDKRLLVIESEFASVLSVSGREGSTLSEVLRNAWDSGDLQLTVKNNPLRATGAHVSVVGHITEPELKARMSENAIFNGFCNRFLMVCVKRSKLLPDGGNLTDDDIGVIGLKLNRAIDGARKIRRVTRSPEARELWHRVYPELTAERHGNFGAITSRAEAHVLRLSIIYALLDGCSEIQVCHLRAALACWRYCSDSALYIWGESMGGIAEKIRQALIQAAAQGLNLTQISNALGKNVPAKERDQALAVLEGYGLVRTDSERTAGRKATRFFIK